jgi:hypothetical protein
MFTLFLYYILLIYCGNYIGTMAQALIIMTNMYAIVAITQIEHIHLYVYRLISWFKHALA